MIKHIVLKNNKLPGNFLSLESKLVTHSIHNELTYLFSVKSEKKKKYGVTRTKLSPMEFYRSVVRNKCYVATITHSPLFNTYVLWINNKHHSLFAVDSYLSIICASQKRTGSFTQTCIGCSLPTSYVTSASISLVSSTWD